MSLDGNDTVLAVVLWDELRGYASYLPTKFARLRRISSSTNRNIRTFSGAIEHFIMLIICSTGRACLGILLIDRISVPWHELEESTSAAAAHEYWCRYGMNTCVCACSYSGSSDPSVWAMG